MQEQFKKQNMQISIRGYITSKKTELFYDCADRYSYDKSQNKFAISDGVSKSFFPKIWADVLVSNWVNRNWNTDKEFIDQSQKDWLQQVTETANKPDAKWFTKNAFHRKEPGLATFVGLRFYEKEKKKKTKKKDWLWRAEALGDSFLFFVPKKINHFSKEFVVLSSKQDPIVFDNFPDYLSSIGNKHKGYPGQKIENKILEEGTFYLMTDALAEWFLNEKENAIKKISVWENQKDFERFVDEERLNGSLENDDSAILKIKIDEDKKDKLTYVSEEVSNINELIKAQQKENEVSEKAKEQETIVQNENANSETETEQQQQVQPEENILTEEQETEIEKPKKGFFKRIFGKEENEHSDEQAEIETDEKVELSEKHRKEEPSLQNEENKTEIEKSEDSEKNKSQEIESKSKEEPKPKAKKLNKDAQNTINKF